jgi:hypothetical protein
MWGSICNCQTMVRLQTHVPTSSPCSQELVCDEVSGETQERYCHCSLTSMRIHYTRSTSECLKTTLGAGWLGAWMASHEERRTVLAPSAWRAPCPQHVLSRGSEALVTKMWLRLWKDRGYYLFHLDPRSRANQQSFLSLTFRTTHTMSLDRTEPNGKAIQWNDSSSFPRGSEYLG